VTVADAPGEAALRRRLALEAALAAAPPPGLLELTPGFTTLLLEFDDPAALPAAAAETARRLAALPDASAPPAGRLVEVPVRYDGPDLGRVARHAGLTTEEVIRRHAAGDYVVQLLGFAPGFPYLHGLDPRLHTPRLDAPRARAPAGAVAIGGEHAGIYPAELPGGWNLLGLTPRPLLDPARAAAGDPAAFALAPGDRVRFVPLPP
jgi:KipI family sensor histidine kinase inhibitor